MPFDLFYTHPTGEMLFRDKHGRVLITCRPEEGGREFLVFLKGPIKQANEVRTELPFEITVSSTRCHMLWEFAVDADLANVLVKEGICCFESVEDLDRVRYPKPPQPKRDENSYVDTSHH